MAVKLLILKSLEDVIADVTEDITGKYYTLSNPVVTRLDGDKLSLERGAYG